jgi:hypothetical protein
VFSTTRMRQSAQRAYTERVHEVSELLHREAEPTVGHVVDGSRTPPDRHAPSHTDGLQVVRQNAPDGPDHPTVQVSLSRDSRSRDTGSRGANETTPPETMQHRCCVLRVAHHVVAGESWGTLPDSLKPWWQVRRCASSCIRSLSLSPRWRPPPPHPPPTRLIQYTRSVLTHTHHPHVSYTATATIMYS